MKRKLLALILVLSIVVVTIVCLSSCNHETILSFQEYKDRGVLIESEICVVKDDYKSIVTIISDDGYYESGVIFNELAKELDINVTVAGAVNIISNKAKEWKQIEAEGHVDIVSHSYSHIKVCPEANLTNEQIRREYVAAKEYYEKNFKTPTFTIVAPENITTEYGFSVWREIGLLAARLGARGENPLKEQITYGTAQGEWLNLRIRGLYDAKDTAGRNAWIDSAINNGTWIIEMWHDISPNGDVHFQPISTEKAREHLAYVSQQQKAKNIWAASFTQAVSYIYQRDYGQVEAYRMGDSIAVNYNRLKEDLPWDKFNVPVTVKITIPDDLDIKTVYNGKSNLDFEIVNGNIIFDMPTDGTTIYLKQ